MTTVGLAVKAPLLRLCHFRGGATYASFQACAGIAHLPGQPQRGGLLAYKRAQSHALDNAPYDDSFVSGFVHLIHTNCPDQTVSTRRGLWFNSWPYCCFSGPVPLHSGGA